VIDAYFSEAVLEERCTSLRALFLEDGTASAADLDPYWPGGDENSLAGADAWIVAFTRLHWCLGRQIGKEEAQRQSVTMSAAQADVLRALRADPEEVALVDDDGTGRSVFVYPKSAMALERIGAIALLTAYLADAEEAIVADIDPESLDLLSQARAKRGYLERLACWIVTHEGPGLPFSAFKREPELPEHIERLTPVDYYLISAAFQRVNGERLKALDATGEKGTRPDWGGFFVGAATELGVAAKSILTDLSLVEVVATVSEKARVHAEARARAEDERKGSRSFTVGAD